MQIEPKGCSGAKRLYLPGVQLRTLCPQCGYPADRDFEHEALEYENWNTPFRLGFMCRECNTEWGHTMKLNLTVDID